MANRSTATIKGTWYTYFSFILFCYLTSATIMSTNSSHRAFPTSFMLCWVNFLVSNTLWPGAFVPTYNWVPYYIGVQTFNQLCVILALLLYFGYFHFKIQPEEKFSCLVEYIIIVGSSMAYFTAIPINSPYQAIWTKQPLAYHVSFKLRFTVASFVHCFFINHWWNVATCSYFIT